MPLLNDVPSAAVDDDESLQALGEVAGQFARPDMARVHRGEAEAAGFSREVWSQLADMEWLSLLVPAELGGAGADHRAATLVAERLGYGGFTEPYVAAGLMPSLCLARCAVETGAGERAPALLARVVSGDLLASVAWQDEQGALDVEGTPVVAERVSDGLVLNGASRWVNVPAADGFIVAVRGEQGLQLVWLDVGQDGVVVTREGTGGGLPMGRLALTGVLVLPDAVLAEPPVAASILRDVIDMGVLGCAAELIGLSRRVVDLTMSYLTTRHQFGRPIGSFQVLQHRAVDLWVRLRIAEAAMNGALRRISESPGDPTVRAVAASSVKARASKSALWICREAVQLHGALGFTAEYELGHHLNRALGLSAWLGNAGAHEQRFGQLVPLQSGQPSEEGAARG